MRLVSPNSPWVRDYGISRARSCWAYAFIAYNWSSLAWREITLVNNILHVCTLSFNISVNRSSDIVTIPTFLLVLQACSLCRIYSRSPGCSGRCFRHGVTKAAKNYTGTTLPTMSLPRMGCMYTMPFAHEFFDALPFYPIEVRCLLCCGCGLKFHTKVTEVGKRS